MSRRVIGSTNQSENEPQLHYEDPLLPVQTLNHKEASPCVNIRNHTLLGALRDLRATGRDAKEIQAKAIAWFDGSIESNPGFSLIDVCDVLELQPPAIRKAADDILHGRREGEPFDWSEDMSRWRLWK